MTYKNIVYYILLKSIHVNIKIVLKIHLLSVIVCECVGWAVKVYDLLYLACLVYDLYAGYPLVTYQVRCGGRGWLGILTFHL